MIAWHIDSGRAFEVKESLNTDNSEGEADQKTF